MAMPDSEAKTCQFDDLTNTFFNTPCCTFLYKPFGTDYVFPMILAFLDRKVGKYIPDREAQVQLNDIRASRTSMFPQVKDSLGYLLICTTYIAI